MIYYNDRVYYSFYISSVRPLLFFYFFFIYEYYHVGLRGGVLGKKSVIFARSAISPDGICDPASFCFIYFSERPEGVYS